MLHREPSEHHQFKSRKWLCWYVDKIIWMMNKAPIIKHLSWINRSCTSMDHLVQYIKRSWWHWLIFWKVPNGLSPPLPLRMAPFSGNHLHVLHTIWPSYLLACMQPYVANDTVNWDIYWFNLALRLKILSINRNYVSQIILNISFPCQFFHWC